MSDININITTDEESKINMNVMETVPVGKYEEKINKVLGGNMPITLAYKENTGLANDENYPSLKYLAECFEYFRGEIGGSGGSVDLSNYYTKEEIDDKIFTFTCDIIENPEVDGEVEAKNPSATYEEIFAAYETGKTIKAIANLSDRNRLMLDLTGFKDDGFYFSNVGGDSTLVLFLGNGIVLAFITYLQLVDNMLTKIEGSENVETCYPSVKAVADYVAKYGGNVDLSDYYTKTEINKMELADKAWVVAQIGLNADNYYNKSIIDEKIGDIEALLGGI